MGMVFSKTAVIILQMSGVSPEMFGVHFQMSGPHSPVGMQLHPVIWGESGRWSADKPVAEQCEHGIVAEACDAGGDNRNLTEGLSASSGRILSSHSLTDQ